MEEYEVETRWKRVNILSRSKAEASAKKNDEDAKPVEEGKAAITADKKVALFWCPFCPEIFESKDELLRHKNRIHLGIPPKECGFCVQETNVYGSLENQVGFLSRIFIF